MTFREVYRKSTPQERWAERKYRELQHEAKVRGWMDETALLETSQVMGILVERNKRLGLILKEKT